MIFLGIEILAGAYLGAKLLEKYRAGSKRLDNAPKVGVGKVGAGKISDHYLKVSVISVGLAIIRHISLPLRLLSTCAIAYSVIPILKQAERSVLKERKVGHDVLVSTLAVMALLTGQYLGLAVGIFIYHVAEKILTKTKNNSKEMLARIFEQKPRNVWVLKSKIEIKVPLDAVNVGDIVVVNTGEIIPIDGIIIEGMAMVDQHTLTGEFQPVEKGTEDNVFASTYIMSGRILVSVEKTGEETVIAEIGDILNHTADFKNQLQLKGEKWADNVAIPILGLSAFALPILGPIGATALINSSFGNRIKLLAPLGTLNHLNLAYQKGILIKDGRAIEALNQVDTLLFDKTGTLTNEQPEVGSIIVCDDENDINSILGYAAVAEGKLDHPIAKAIVRKAKESNLILPDIDDAQYHIGYGITVVTDDITIKVGSLRFMEMIEIVIPEVIEEAIAHSHSNGHTLVIVSINSEIKGAIEIQPKVRPEVKQIISDLRQSGIKHFSIVSGDHKQPTRKLAEALDMDSYFSDALPQDKANIIKKLQKEGKKVGFVGDGINDVLAMKAADVSISIHGATSIATDAAQIILMDDSLSQLPELFELSRSLEANLKNTLRIIMVPVALDIGGAFFLRFNMMNTVILNNIGFLLGLINVMLPYKKVESGR
uniref:P-type Zn(2+) transporter n=1 Tax=Candidatus Kentrum eta TaxID=2126337 RepID=A0A450UFA6_9GAMM|nr:MAG: Cu2+-exporting ATPase [Candidatus Kentron sp. H]VFJ92333.1 MAG: Cu2+-exporting ATPase [Candidatus Kentron sp. H]VFJ98946.1 MAG: Cu2+-exporting ATPase [Candidatus Kentron sp. H]